MMIGFLESYLLGLAPSRMPPCFAAREAAVVAVAAFAVTVAVTVESILLAIVRAMRGHPRQCPFVADRGQMGPRLQLGWMQQGSAAVVSGQELDRGSCQILSPARGSRRL